ncbi:TPA: hypothetical protein ACH3X1_012680 [Trebouxia sp. C0004]
MAEVTNSEKGVEKQAPQAQAFYAGLAVAVVDIVEIADNASDGWLKLCTHT